MLIRCEIARNPSLGPLASHWFDQPLSFGALRVSKKRTTHNMMSPFFTKGYTINKHRKNRSNITSIHLVFYRISSYRGKIKMCLPMNTTIGLNTYLMANIAWIKCTVTHKSMCLKGKWKPTQLVWTVSIDYIKK